MLSMPAKFKFTLLQARAKNDYFYESTDQKIRYSTMTPVSVAMLYI